MVIEKKETEMLELLEPPLRESKKRGLPNVGGEIGKTILVAFVVVFLFTFGMSALGKGGFFVNKVDFATNLADILTTVEQVKTDMAKNKSEVTAAIQGIPGTASTYVNNAVTQATSQWNVQLSTLSDKVTSATSSSQTSASKVVELTNLLNSSVASLIAKNTELANKLSALETKIGDYEKRIKGLEDSVVELKSQYNLSNVSVTTVITTPSITNNVGLVVSYQITNSSNVSLTIPLSLVLTAPSSVTSISSAVMNDTIVGTISGTVVTFYAQVTVPANSTLTTNPQARIIYGGTSPSTWIALWSKR